MAPVVTAHYGPSSTLPLTTTEPLSDAMRPDFVVNLRVGPGDLTETLYAYLNRPLAKAERPAQIDWSEGIHEFVEDDGVHSNGSRPLVWSHLHKYDEKGAMYFAVAVILFYGFSIALLVAASTLKHGDTDDYELKSFIRSYARLDSERRMYEKQRIRDILDRSVVTKGSLQGPPARASLPGSSSQILPTPNGGVSDRWQVLFIGNPQQQSAGATGTSVDGGQHSAQGAIGRATKFPSSSSVARSESHYLLRMPGGGTGGTAKRPYSFYVCGTTTTDGDARIVL